MANTFKNAVKIDVSTGKSTIYTSPASTTSTVIGFSVANKYASEIKISATLYDVSTGTEVYLIKDAPSPVGSTIVIVGGDQKVVLEPGDYITVFSDYNNSADAILSILQITT